MVCADRDGGDLTGGDGGGTSGLGEGKGPAGGKSDASGEHFDVICLVFGPRIVFILEVYRGWTGD